MTANLHLHDAAEKATIAAKLVDKTAWIEMLDGQGNNLALFFNPAHISQIMGQMEKALGELETIAHTMDRDSDGELAPAGVSEQDGAFHVALADDGTGVRVFFPERA
jgi:hypothetical protein